MLAERIYRTPRLIVLGQPGIGWLGLVSSWLTLGFGAVLTSVSAAGLYSPGEACPDYTEVVCGVASWGGVLAGVTSLAVATLCSLAIARGFGPPVLWWIVPALTVTVSTSAFLAAAAGSDAIAPAPLAISCVGAAVTLALLVLLARKGAAAAHGWIRLDGLDAREVPMRSAELVLPACALIACSVGGAFAAHVARLLATD